MTASMWEVKFFIFFLPKSLFNQYLNRLGFSPIEIDHKFGSIVIQFVRINQTITKDSILRVGS